MDIRELFKAELSPERWSEIQYDLDNISTIMDEQFGVLYGVEKDLEFSQQYSLSDFNNLVPLRRYTNQYRFYITCGLQMDPVLAIALPSFDEADSLIHNSLTPDPFEYLDLWKEAPDYRKLDLDKIREWEGLAFQPDFYPIIELYWPLLWIYCDKRLFIQLPVLPITMVALMQKYHAMNDVDLSRYPQQRFRVSPTAGKDQP